MIEIPADRLPPGLLERVESPPTPPATPRPAATVVLLRDLGSGPETLLLRRGSQAAFMPGTYVFPGGAVDPDDSDPRLLMRAEGLSPDARPEPCYRMAALREALEETGILLAKTDEGPIPDAARNPALAKWREALLLGDVALHQVVEALDARLSAGDLVYFAHWITPVSELRRFDTRFFLAPVPGECVAMPDRREMTDAGWFTPSAALDAYREGRLPLVFPTVRTLEALASFDTVDAALAAFRDQPVQPILPRFVRTRTGVAIVDDRGE